MVLAGWFRMDRIDARDQPGPPRAWLAAAGALLLALSWWAFSDDTTRVATTAGVRVDPGDAYNPVAAGERLPDGFRQLLPRDAIRPVYEPTFVPGDEIAWSPLTDVIGVEIGGEAKAYPVSFLNGRELVVDDLGDVPILVSW